MSESIFSRYSCRKFSEKPVTEEQLTAIARAGMCAPTARNERPWEFLIVRSKEGRKKIAEASPYAESCLEAQAVIIAAGKQQENISGQSVVDSGYERLCGKYAS